MQSDTITWGAAVLLSLLAHSMMFVQSGARMGVESASVLQAQKITRLSFTQLADRPVLDEPRLVKTKPPMSVPRRSVKHVAPRPKPKKPVEKYDTVRQLAALPQVKGQQVSQPSDGLLQRERQLYLHKLLSHIESHKFYPRAARKRSMEGDVKISFTLRDDGYYEQLKLDGGRAVLVEAAREALESAKPLPVPPKDINFSRQIELSMVYSLAR